MQEDTALIEQVRHFMVNQPSATTIDIVTHFKLINVPERKILYILREIFG